MWTLWLLICRPAPGDIQITLSQRLHFDGAVIVSTPQDIALIDAVKGVNMFRKVDVPILGIIENMSYYLCEKCGHRADIFGHEGARKTAEKLGESFWARFRCTFPSGRMPTTVRRLFLPIPTVRIPRRMRRIAAKIAGELGFNQGK